MFVQLDRVFEDRHGVVRLFDLGVDPDAVRLLEEACTAIVAGDLSLIETAELPLFQLMGCLLGALLYIQGDCGHEPGPGRQSDGDRGGVEGLGRPDGGLLG